MKKSGEASAKGSATKKSPNSGNPPAELRLNPYSRRDSCVGD